MNQPYLNFNQSASVDNSNMLFYINITPNVRIIFVMTKNFRKKRHFFTENSTTHPPLEPIGDTSQHLCPSPNSTNHPTLHDRNKVPLLSCVRTQTLTHVNNKRLFHKNQTPLERPILKTLYLCIVKRKQRLVTVIKHKQVSNRY